VATREQIGLALKRAAAAGDQEGARRLAAAYQKADGKLYLGALPGMATDPSTFRAPLEEPKPIDPLGEAAGALETGATLATGMTTGTAGMIGGMLKGMAEQILRGDFGTPQASDLIAKSAQEGAEALTYAPRSEAGQRNVGAIGEAAQSLAPLIAVTPVEGALAASSLGKAVAPAASVARSKVGEAAKSVRAAITPDAPPASGAGPRSAGAAEAGAALIRETNASQLPVPIKLTRGQKTREFSDVQFEREAAKNAKVGAPLRERYDTQRAQLVQNIDAFVDGTGGIAPDLRSVGLSVEKGLRVKAVRDKRRIRTLYKEAEKRGELDAPVQLDGLVKHLNDSRSLEGTAKNLPAVRKELLRLGAAAEDANGNLTAQPVSLKDGELLRKFVNKATGNDKTEQFQAVEIKKAYDADTAGAGGQLYQKARKAYSKYQDDFQGQLTVKNILGTKRGGKDRQLAYEDVLNRSVLAPSASLDQVEGMFRLLEKSTAGKQAVADIKAGVLEHLKTQATKNVGTDSAGNKLFSAAGFDKAVKQLDSSGKLDFVFGKKGAEQLRTLNEISQDVLTVPPGTVNTSNTASALAALADITLSAGTGIPAPIVSAIKILRTQVKDAKLKKRLDDSLQ
jgi:hypothetical protein